MKIMIYLVQLILALLLVEEIDIQGEKAVVLVMGIRTRTELQYLMEVKI
jgi:hypothetical protein